jgi:hypothetical protein
MSVIIVCPPRDKEVHEGDLLDKNRMPVAMKARQCIAARFANAVHAGTANACSRDGHEEEVSP